MPPPANTKEFLQLLDRSGLAESAQIKESISRIRESGARPTTPKELAQLLIDQELITEFHAEQLLSGRHRGFMVGKYKILEMIGSGGMGRVYLAEHIIMRRRVAVKVLPRAKSSDPSALGRFQREARAVAALKHPNIVQAYDIDEDRELHYMVMEYVDGMSVQEYVKRFGTIPWPQAVDYICQAADGLDHANRAGLIHRDIKPGNLLIDTEGVIKLLDMGLAVFFEESDRESLTLAYDENVLGTADYLSPEQALDSHNVDIRADIYSLGGTLYYMLAGQPPFPEGTIAQKLLWHQSKEPRPIEELSPGLPEAIGAILRKMMAKKREDRFATPGEVREALLPFAKRVEDPFQGKPIRLRSSKPGSSRNKSVSPPMLGESDKGAVPAADVRSAPEASKPPSSKPALAKPASARPASPGRDGGSGESPTKMRPQRKSQPGPGPAFAEKSDNQAVSEVRFEPVSDVGDDDSPFGSQQIPDFSPQTTALESSDDSGDFLRALGDSSPRVATSQTPTVDSTSSSDTSTKGASSASRIVPVSTTNDKRKWLLIGGAGAAVVLIAAVAAFFFLSGPTKEDQPVVKEEPKQEAPPQRDLSNALVVGGSGADAKVSVDDALIEAESGSLIYITKVGPWNQTPVEIGPRSLLFPDKDGITIEGATPETIIQRSGSIDDPLFVIDGAREVKLKNLILDGAGGMGPVLEIRGAGVQGFSLENVRIRNFQGVGLRIVSADGQPAEPITFTGLTIQATDPAGYGVEIAPPVTGGAGTHSMNLRFVNAQISGPFAAGFHVLQTTRGLQLEECTISGGTAGVRVAAAHTGWTISGTSFIELETGIFSTIATDKSANDIGSMKDNTFQKVLYEFQSPAAPPAATPTPAAPAPQPSDATPKDSQ